jgi:hypothetical protein
VSYDADDAIAVVMVVVVLVRLVVAVKAEVVFLVVFGNITEWVRRHRKVRENAVGILLCTIAIHPTTGIFVGRFLYLLFG